MLEKFKEIFESNGGKFKPGTKIELDGDIYTIIDKPFNDKMAGLWTYPAEDDKGNELTLDMKYVDKNAKKVK